jgi:hypothetical protein
VLDGFEKPPFQDYTPADLTMPTRFPRQPFSPGQYENMLLENSPVSLASDTWLEVY